MNPSFSSYLINDVFGDPGVTRRMRPRSSRWLMEQVSSIASHRIVIVMQEKPMTGII